MGGRFSEAIKRQATSLDTMPEKYRIALENIHVCSVPKFPFELYYKIEDEQVIVLVVHAVRQDPDNLIDKFER